MSEGYGSKTVKVYEDGGEIVNSEDKACSEWQRIVYEAQKFLGIL